MATRDIYIKGHIQGFVNMIADDGEEFCHVQVEDDGPGKSMISGIKGPSLIYDNGVPGANWNSVNAKYKDDSGNPRHEFGGTSPDNPVIPV